jgi:CBS-domain-containing membrane protein
VVLTIGAVMSEGAIAVNERSGVPELVATIERCRARTVAVVDAFGQLLGTIDRDDYPELFLQCVPPHAPRVARTPRQRDRRALTGRCRTRELMSAFPFVTDNCTIAEALRSLDSADADFAFVVDHLGCVLGTITTLACRAVLRTGGVRWSTSDSSSSTGASIPSSVPAVPRSEQISRRSTSSAYRPGASRTLAA